MEYVSRMPLIGDRFPEVVVQTTHGVKKLPEAFKGKWFVLFSHPGDFTPVCTTEFVSFASKVNEFSKLNTDLIGLSVDQVFAHMKWTEWIRENLGVNIPFPIIADEQGLIAKQLGMIHPNKGTNTVRAVFVVDDRGVIRLILYYPQEVGRNISEIIRAIKALQIADAHTVALPEDWPKNALIGNKVILPPANTEKMKQKRLDDAQNNVIDCFDWWFCYKGLSE